MGVNKKQCECCGEQHIVCPECGGDHVTPREHIETPLPRDIIDYEDGDTEITYTHVCWDCDWSESVTMTVTRE